MAMMDFLFFCGLFCVFFLLFSRGIERCLKILKLRRRLLGLSLLFVFVVRTPRRRNRPAGVQTAVRELPLVRRFENLETAHQGVVHRHHGTRVVEFTAIIWR